MFENRFDRIKVKMTGSHYQPDGCSEAFIVGISWDKEEHRPCIHALYTNGKEDFIPLSELGSSHFLGDVIILNGFLTYTKEV